MDPAETERMRQALSSQGTLVGQHEATLRQVLEHLQELTTSVMQLGGRVDSLTNLLTTSNPSAELPQPPEPPVDFPDGPMPQPREPYIPIPARYAGDLGTCAQFLHQCSLVFNQQAVTYSTDRSKVAFVMSLLTEQAAAWALAVSGQCPELCSDYRNFSEEMKRVFDHPVKGREAVSQLLELRQGSQPVAQFAVNFRILAVESGWNDSALQAIFLKGLSGEIKDELAVRDETTSLNELIELAIRLDNRVRERRRERSVRPKLPPFPPSPRNIIAAPLPTPPPSTMSEALSRAPVPAPLEEPMQLGRARLAPAERQRRLRDRLCMYCAQEGHFRAQCPEVPKDRAHQ